MLKAAIFATALTAGVTLCPLPSQAHHAVQTAFDITSVVKFAGQFVRIDWVNPHAWMHFVEVDAKTGRQSIGKDGKPISWMVEAAAPGTLRSLGVRDEKFFVPGTIYEVRVHPSRTPGEQSGHVVSIKLPNNEMLYLGDGPDMG